MVGIPAAVLSSSVASTTATICAFGLFMPIHELPMFGFLGWTEVFIFTGIIPLGFNVSTGINLFLRWFVGARVIPASSTASTITTPPAGTPSSKGQDASPGCPRVVKDGCGSL